MAKVSMELMAKPKVITATLTVVIQMNVLADLH